MVVVPGLPDLQLEHLLLDVNGTLTDRGALIEGVETRLDRLRNSFAVQLVSADTFGTLDAIAGRLQVSSARAASGEDKLRELDRLGRDRSVVIGNGANDALVLEAAALGIVVLGPEGASSRALRAADIVCSAVTDALDLLLDPTALLATLRP